MNIKSIFCLIALSAITVGAQSLEIKGVEISPSADCRVALSLDGTIRYLSLSPGTLIRDKQEQITGIGNATITRNKHEQITSVGDITINRDKYGRIIGVGSIIVDRDRFGRMTTVGNATVRRDRKGQVTSVDGDPQVHIIMSSGSKK